MSQSDAGQSSESDIEMIELERVEVNGVPVLREK